MHTTDPAEIERFSRIAEEWWNPTGKFSPLHAMNEARVEWILSQIPDIRHPTSGIRILDIGCGGGLVCEPLARLGAKVTGIDASEKNIAVARTHAEKSGLAIDYRVAAPEQITETFDAVLALEIVEHVADVDAFLHACAARTKPGGVMVFSTLNRTLKSYAFAIAGAEYILRLLPIGTHDWKRFLKPSELALGVERAGGLVTGMTGLVMHPLTRRFRLVEKDVTVNYMLAAQKSLD